MASHPPIPIMELADHLERLKANDNLKFSQEYEVCIFLTLELCLPAKSSGTPNQTTIFFPPNSQHICARYSVLLIGWELGNTALRL